MGLPEIIPPQRGQVTRIEPARITASVPTVYSGNPFTAGIAAWSMDQNTKLNNAFARLNEAEGRARIQQTALVVAQIEHSTKLFELQELPEKLGHELAVRRVGRANELRNAQHTFERDEMDRMQVIVCAETNLNRAKTLRTQSRTALVDAEQQLQAQMEFGGMKYVLQHKKAALEIMEVELDMEQRKAILKDYLAKGTAAAGGDGGDGGDDDDEINDALQRYLQILTAKGLDTERLEAVIAARRKK